MILLKLISWPYVRQHLPRWLLTIAGIVSGLGAFLSSIVALFFRRRGRYLSIFVGLAGASLAVLLSLELPQSLQRVVAEVKKSHAEGVALAAQIHAIRTGGAGDRCAVAPGVAARVERGTAGGAAVRQREGGNLLRDARFMLEARDAGVCPMRPTRSGSDLLGTGT